MAGKAKPVLPALEAGPVPLLEIRAQARKQLVDIIDSRRGKKALVLDASISGSLTQLDAGLSELFTEHGISKLLYLERTRLDDAAYNAAEPRLCDIRPVIYIARATLENAALIAWQVKAAVQQQQQAAAAAAPSSSGRPSSAQQRQQQQPQPQQQQQRHEFSVFWVPRRSVAVERVLEDEGVYGDVQQGEFSALDMVPLEDDVLSLELDAAFRECTLEGDTSSLCHAAAALLRLQRLYGLIPRLQGKGAAAAAVRDMAVRMRREAPLPPAAAAACRIHRAVLIDREVDVVTPLLTQLTFEGLIDEVTGIRNGAVPYAKQQQQQQQQQGGGGAASGAAAAAASAGAGAGAAQQGGAAAATLLNSSDPFYREFRDLPYWVTSQRLQQYAREARAEYAQLASKDLTGLRTFVKGLPKLLLLDRLSDLAVPVAEVVRRQGFHDRLKLEADLVEGYDADEGARYVTELMWRGVEPLVVLRLLCLMSATCGGLPRRHADSLRSEFLATYGHQHLVTLNHLGAAGLLRPQPQGSGRGGGGGGGAIGGAIGGGGGGPGAGFAAARKALRLVVPEADAQMQSPTDVAHLHKGYAPLSIRLVEAALRGAWGGGGGGGGGGAQQQQQQSGAVAEALAALPGAQFDTLQVLEPSGAVVDRPVRGAAAAAAAAAAATTASGGGDGEPEVVLVVFLGGVTFTEISALRWLASRPGATARFLVLTTKIVNGRTLLEPFIDPPARQMLAAPPYAVGAGGGGGSGGGGAAGSSSSSAAAQR